jgi:hypothetical protein
VTRPQRRPDAKLKGAVAEEITVTTEGTNHQRIDH